MVRQRLVSLGVVVTAAAALGLGIAGLPRQHRDPPLRVSASSDTTASPVPTAPDTTPGPEAAPAVPASTSTTKEVPAGPDTVVSAQPWVAPTTTAARSHYVPPPPPAPAPAPAPTTSPPFTKAPPTAPPASTAPTTKAPSSPSTTR